ncbi:hypothetical protein [Flavobacterium sp. JP2137]|uniref:hypothetical protein n=1 Tax=Flavobacterium sp. JP2137 TaxID=3414510 RepID=UPI003D30103A
MKDLLKFFKILGVVLAFVSCSSDDSSSDDGDGGGNGGGSSNKLHTTWTMTKKHQIAYQSGSVIYDRTDPYKDGEITYRFDNDGSFYGQEFGKPMTTTYRFDQSKMIIYFLNDINGNQVKTLTDSNLTLWGFSEREGIRAETTMYFKKYGGSSGGGNGGGGNGGGGSNGNSGKVSFWVNYDYGCGPIYVSINGQSQTITSYYESVPEGCTSSGNANFTFPPGTYSFSATCSSRNWNGTVEIKPDGCLRMNLTI